MTVARRTTAVIRWLVPFAVFAAFGILWALASPVFSVPDENAHALKAVAQMRGQIVGETVPGVRHIVVDLPEGYEYSEQILCFATADQVPAECDGVDLGEEGNLDWFATWVGAYNPVYYALVGWPSLFVAGDAGVIAMRIVSAMLGAALLAFGAQAALAGARAAWMPLGVAFAAAPMCAYLLGSVNPNGAELAAAGALWALVPRLLETFDGDPARHPSLSRTWLWIGTVTSAAVLVNARALGPLWLLIVLGVCLIAAPRRRVVALFTTRASYAWAAIIAVAAIFSVGWTLGGGSLSNQAEASDAPFVGGTFLQGAWYMARSTPDLLQQAIGYFGWLDAPLPLWTYWFFIAAFSALVLLALAALRRRPVLVLALLIALSVVVPIVVQAYSVSQTGIIWQGRYGLFLYLGIPILAAWMLSDELPALAPVAPRMTAIAGGLLGAYGILAFFLALARYVIGARRPLDLMLSDPAWQPPLGWLTLTVLYVLVTAAAVVIATIASRAAARATSPATEAARG